MTTHRDAVGPFWQYYGGKWRAAPKYPTPTRSLIVDPFAGAAGYSCRHYKRDVLLIDANPVVVQTWQWLIAASPSDILALPPQLESGVRVDSLGLDAGATLFLRWWTNLGAASPRRTPTRRALTNGWSPSIRAKLAADVAQIKHWRVMLGSYRDAPDVDACWFVDPPYIGAAGAHYPSGSKAIDYAHLGEWCKDRQGQVIVCEADGASWLPFVRVGEFRAMSGKHRKGTSAEAVWLRGCEMSNGRQTTMLDASDKGSLL